MHSLKTSVGRFYRACRLIIPAAITLERATELIRAKQANAAANTLKVFEGSPIQVLKGRYGPYITDGKKKNVNVPKDKKPEDLTLEECTALLGGTKGGKTTRSAKKAAGEPKATAAPKKKAAKRAKSKKA